MYMGVILTPDGKVITSDGAPHVYGGDPQDTTNEIK